MPPWDGQQKKILGGGGGLELVCGRPTLALASALVHQTKQLRTTKTKRIKHKREAKRAAGIEGQVASVLEYVQVKYTQQTQQEYNEPGIKGTTKRRQNRRAALGRPAMKLLGGFN